LGSSAAFNTSLALGLLEFFEENFSSDSFSEEKLAIINKYSFEVEKIMHGTPSGIDNSTSTYGGVIAFTAGNINHIASIPPLRILITNTNVARNTKLLVQKVGTLCSTYPKIAEPLLDSVHTISQTILEKFRNYAIHRDKNDDDGNSIKNVEVFMENLMAVNHHILGALGVGHKVLDDVYHESAKFGLFTKLTGAGGGGCAYTLIRSSVDPGTVSTLVQNLKEMGFECYEAEIGAKGAQVHKACTTFPNLEFYSKL